MPKPQGRLVTCWLSPKSRLSEVALSALLVRGVIPDKVTRSVRAKTGIFGTPAISVVRVMVGRWPPCSRSSKQCREIPGQNGMKQKKRPIFFIFFLSFLFFPFLFNLKFSLNRGNPQRGENWEPGPEQAEGLPGPASLPGFGRQICSLAAGIWVPRQWQLAKIRNNNAPFCLPPQLAVRFASWPCSSPSVTTTSWHRSW